MSEEKDQKFRAMNAKMAELDPSLATNFRETWDKLGKLRSLLEDLAKTIAEEPDGFELTIQVKPLRKE